MGIGEDILRGIVGAGSGLLNDTPDRVYTAKTPTLDPEALPEYSEQLRGQLQGLTGPYQQAPQSVREAATAGRVEQSTAGLRGAQKALNQRGQAHGIAERSPALQHQHTDLWRQYMQDVGQAGRDFDLADYDRWAADRRFGLSGLLDQIQHASTYTEQQQVGGSDFERALGGLLQALGGDGGGAGGLLSTLLKKLKEKIANRGGGGGGGGSNFGGLDWDNLAAELGQDLGIALLGPDLQALADSFAGFFDDTPGISLDFDLNPDNDLGTLGDLLDLDLGDIGFDWDSILGDIFNDPAWDDIGFFDYGEIEDFLGGDFNFDIDGSLGLGDLSVGWESDWSWLDQISDFSGGDPYWQGPI